MAHWYWSAAHGVGDPQVIVPKYAGSCSATKRIGPNCGESWPWLAGFGLWCMHDAPAPDCRRHASRLRSQQIYLWRMKPLSADYGQFLIGIHTWARVFLINMKSTGKGDGQFHRDVVLDTVRMHAGGGYFFLALGNVPSLACKCAHWRQHSKLRCRRSLLAHQLGIIMRNDGRVSTTLYYQVRTPSPTRLGAISQSWIGIRVLT